jgi:NAD(P)-dependent dehydrogenase (short-subunit alcohol dehydrogenase family)
VEISGKKAIVFGGGSGMGRASAEAMAARGAQVAVVDRPGSAGKDVAAALGGSYHEMDVTDFEGTERVIADAVDGLGGLHVTPSPPPAAGRPSAR